MIEYDYPSHAVQVFKIYLKVQCIGERFMAGVGLNIFNFWEDFNIYHPFLNSSNACFIKKNVIFKYHYVQTPANFYS